MHRKVTTIAAAAVIAGTALAGSASAATLKGTVVHANKRAHSFVVAGRSGKLAAIHARKSPRVGRLVTVRARKLRNGTYGASRVHVGRRSHRAHFRGVVTFVDRAHARFVVSARGVSLAVHRKRSRAAAAADTMPAPGTQVTVDGSIDDQGDIEADTVENDGENNNSSDLEGRVLNIDPQGRTLTITADDNDEIQGGTITVHIPDTFDITSYHVNDMVQILATLNPDGTYTAVNSSQDDSSEEADNEQHQEGDHHSDGSQSDANKGGND
jgi:hypothetical protein